jgi:hypothetical protein
VNTAPQAATAWNSRRRPSRTPVAVGPCAICEKPWVGKPLTDEAVHGHCLDVIARMDRDLAARRTSSGDVTRPVYWLNDVQW